MFKTTETPPLFIVKAIVLAIALIASLTLQVSQEREETALNHQCGAVINFADIFCAASGIARRAG